ncbi:septum site-determining protein MinC [Carboxydochorda subterranea]|uniref:Probable septum site-determining protein MinC n=1 Tax=Carboxydichorda subterranea TaxID=3109565 RepID=A0ABZ1BZF7_9FIRM|nr:septum site-determining protein MinC [Limnochorda sp. L945t]WRP18220.1 septum site-determining protein MinC [Limnochorda sp. L945t]
MASLAYGPRHDVVVLKGSRRGLRVVLDEEAPLDELVEALERKLQGAGRFFEGASVWIEAGQRRGTWADWCRVVGVLTRRGLQVREWQLVEPPEPPGEAGPGAVPADGRAAAPAVRAVVGSAELAHEVALAGLRPTESRRPAASSVAASRTLLVRRTLRSGQRIAYDGHLVVVGDVNPGAEVIASGDIVVMGTLRGVAHAGARGDEGAVVLALRLAPLQLRIAHRVARSPEEGAVDRGPEVAWIREGVVEVQPYPAALEEGTWEWQGAS